MHLPLKDLEEWVQRADGVTVKATVLAGTQSRQGGACVTEGWGHTAVCTRMWMAIHTPGGLLTLSALLLHTPPPQEGPGRGVLGALAEPALSLAGRGAHVLAFLPASLLWRFMRAWMRPLLTSRGRPTNDWEKATP